ncbi:NgoFVII family restriction endonuclease, partial [Alphaproteobacteria bacterium]|nr:NgoFVII family restriction endonuclease [Alphaproteobacteria bacterium]
EATVELKDIQAKKEITEYLEWLDDINQSQYIDKIKNTATPKTKSYTKPRMKKGLNVNKIDPSTLKLSGTKSFEISLSRNIKNRQRSSLNTYFGKGRLNRKTGVVTPREWYEGEVIASVKETSNPLYPKGVFEVITDDGWVFECKPQGPNGKNLRSTNDLNVLGQWIKIKLEDKGSLVAFNPVNEKTFKHYGTDKLKVFKLSNKRYFFEFKA